VLEPLADLCPNFRHPVLGGTVKQLLGEILGAEFVNK
jgi:dihydroneopterin aldolase/2-amino-4-hydroxy-6-hydroxymethyldihydropteridine diphosphokinase